VNDPAKEKKRQHTGFIFLPRKCKIKVKFFYPDDIKKQKKAKVADSQHIISSIQGRCRDSRVGGGG